ncbi:hypothetical protein CPB84DRAFT_1754627 [Gymnopilus junonius]|uniref:Uncharacterized protein n=1 Tax=Gymnopilus junonius TaxID=109634 RepID=A0A9P5N928_GYMJU|nr:hypothetical protein CPB84DRAFT_1754627 [Gymnopilus junonius]
MFMPIYKQTESFQTKLELGTRAGAGDSVGRVSINLSMAKSLESRIDSTISFCPSITCCLSFDLEWPSVLSIPKHAGLRNGSPKQGIWLDAELVIKQFPNCCGSQISPHRPPMMTSQEAVKHLCRLVIDVVQSIL